MTDRNAVNDEIGYLSVDDIPDHVDYELRRLLEKVIITLSAIDGLVMGHDRELEAILQAFDRMNLLERVSKLDAEITDLKTQMGQRQ